MTWDQAGNFCERCDLSFKFSVSVYLYNNGTKGENSLAPLVLLKFKMSSGVRECAHIKERGFPGTGLVLSTALLSVRQVKGTQQC